MAASQVVAPSGERLRG